jgi:hypothetical protein
MCDFKAEKSHICDFFGAAGAGNQVISQDFNWQESEAISVDR